MSKQDDEYEHFLNTTEAAARIAFWIVVAIMAGVYIVALATS